MTDGAIVCTNRTSWTKASAIYNEMLCNTTHTLTTIPAGDFARLMPGGGGIVGVVKSDLNEGMVHGTALHMIQLAHVLRRFDYVVTIADRYETIATAIAASYMNIPLIHIQGGEITGSIDDKVRNAVTQLSDYHFVSNPEAKRELELMGVSKDRIIVTGCPSISSIPSDEMLRKPFKLDEYGSGMEITSADTFNVIMFHPDTTLPVCEAGKHAEEIWAAAKGIPTIWMLPNVDAHGDEIRKVINRLRDTDPAFTFVRTVDHIPFDLFYRILYHASILIGNSSVAIREGSYLPVKAVNVGARQEGRLTGPNVIHTPPMRHSISEAMAKISKLIVQRSYTYGDVDSAKNVVEGIVKCIQ